MNAEMFTNTVALLMKIATKHKHAFILIISLNLVKERFDKQNQYSSSCCMTTL